MIRILKIRFATLQIFQANKYFAYSWNAYTSQFSKKSWLLVSVWLLTSPVVYWFIKRYQLSFDEQKRMKETNSIVETVFTFFSVVVQQGEFLNIFPLPVHLTLFIKSYDNSKIFNRSLTHSCWSASSYHILDVLDFLGLCDGLLHSGADLFVNKSEEIATFFYFGAGVKRPTLETCCHEEFYRNKYDQGNFVLQGNMGNIFSKEILHNLFSFEKYPIVLFASRQKSCTSYIEQ